MFYEISKFSDFFKPNKKLAPKMPIFVFFSNVGGGGHKKKQISWVKKVFACLWYHISMSFCPLERLEIYTKP